MVNDEFASKMNLFTRKNTEMNDVRGTGSKLTTETYRQANERQTFNQLVKEKWGNRSLAVDRRRPPFADYNGDLFDGAVRLLGNLTDRNILEIGSGSGEIAVWMALQGANVTGIDISDESIAVADKRAEINGVKDLTTFLSGPAESMPFQDNLFDLVFINVSLHHLEIEPALSEFKRVLKPHGLLVAVEPLASSRTIQRIRTSRAVTWLYPIRKETMMERILTTDDIKLLESKLFGLNMTHYRIFSPFVFKAKPVFHLLATFFPGKGKDDKRRSCNRFMQRIDERLLATFPPLHCLSRYVVMSGFNEGPPPNLSKSQETD